MMTVRWGLLGCGDIAHKRVARAIIDHPGSQLLAACRRNTAKLDDFCKKFRVERAYSSTQKLFDDSDLDAIYIATPVHLHCENTLAAARAGKHVLVEKPMALSTAECDEMIAECRRAGVLLGVAYYRRFYPIIQRIKQILASGEIGKPLAISAITATSLAMQPGEDGYWRVIPGEGGGGSLMDIGSHRLNLFLDLFGEIAEVKGFFSTQAGNYEAEDCASLVLRFRSGMHGSLQCFFRAEVDPDEFTILGTKGRLTARPLNGEQLFVEIGSEQRIESHPPPTNLHAPLIDDFAAAISESRLPLVSGEEGRVTSQVMELAYRDATRI